MELRDRRLALAGLALALPAAAGIGRRRWSARKSPGKQVRQAMSADVERVVESESVLDAARKLAEGGIGALPVCDERRKLKGMLTDRDLVTKVLAQGQDPTETRVAELCDGGAVAVDAGDYLDEAARRMVEYKVRRLPVTQGREVVGVVSQADLAEHLPAEDAGELVEAISAAPPDRGAGAWLFERPYL
jgi:CBS domain-containing protein